MSDTLVDVRDRIRCCPVCGWPMLKSKGQWLCVNAECSQSEPREKPTALDKVRKGGQRMPEGLIAHRYWNSNGIGIAIVAIRGQIGDWAAYIGAEPVGWAEADAVLAAAHSGEKLLERLARSIFPTIEGHYRN